MESLGSCFDQALERIELSGPRRDNAIKAHTGVRGTLESSSKLRDWGIDTVLIGSYARRTGVYPGKDVDVFSKLNKLNDSCSPQDVYTTIHDVLFKAYGIGSIEPHDRSIKVKFSFDDSKDQFSVDVVPAVRKSSRWAIPTKDPTAWKSHDANARWVETDPERMTSLTEEKNKHFKVGDRGAYVPIVKLIKQIRSYHLNKQKPGGFFFEILTYWAFDKGEVRGESFAEYLAETLEAIAEQLDHELQNPGSVVDPIMLKSFHPRPAREDIMRAARLMKGFSDDAIEALKLDKCRAAIRWRKILGSNVRGACFPLPDGCDEEGKQVAPVASIRRGAPKEDYGFA